jgi:hypothetical protein
VRRLHGVVRWPLGTSWGSQRAGDAPAVAASQAMGWANGPDDSASTWHNLHSVRGHPGQAASVRGPSNQE